jgi:hypothetical protein
VYIATRIRKEGVLALYVMRLFAEIVAIQVVFGIVRNVMERYVKIVFLNANNVNSVEDIFVRIAIAKSVLIANKGYVVIALKRLLKILKLEI